MKTINLRDFYPWYTHDEYIEVSDEVAAELRADQLYEKAYWQRALYHKAYYSLDVDNGIENCGVLAPSPAAVSEQQEKMRQLYHALGALPSTQARRLAAHYLDGMSYRAIAKIEGVDESTIRITINRGLQRMKNFFENL